MDKEPVESYKGLYKVKPLTINMKDACPTCEPKIKKLLELMNNLPFKYGNKIVLTLHQDYFGGDIWHLENIETGNYELERGSAKKEDVSWSGYR